MRAAVASVLPALLLLAGCPGPTGAAPAEVEVTVLVAASLTETLRSLAPGFEAAHPGARLRLSSGATSFLEKQAEAGARFDLFVGAALAPVERLERAGRLDPTTRVVVATNTLVVIAPAGAPKLGALSDLAGLPRVALGQRGVPVGEYAREALAAAGLLERVTQAGYPDEPAVVAAVAEGGAPAGIVYASSLASHPKRDRVARALDVDPRLHAPVVYPAALAASAEHRELAAAFVALLRGEAGRAALLRAGFSAPEE